MTTSTVDAWRCTAVERAAWGGGGGGGGHRLNTPTRVSGEARSGRVQVGLEGGTQPLKR